MIVLRILSTAGVGRLSRAKKGGGRHLAPSAFHIFLTWRYALRLMQAPVAGTFGLFSSACGTGRFTSGPYAPPL